MQSAYGVGRDWPISYEELEPYYLQAENEMGVAGPNDPAQQSPVERSGPYPMDMVPWAYGDQRFADVVNPHGYRSVPIPQGRSTRPGAASHLLRQQQLPAYLSGRRHVQRHPSCPGGRGEGRHRAAGGGLRSTRTRTIASPPCTGTTRRASRTRPPAGISCWPATRWKPRACCSWPPMNATPPASPIRLTRWAATSWTTRASIASSWPANRSGRDAAGAEQLPGGAARRRLPFGLFGQQDDPEQHHPGRVGHAGRHGHGPGWQGAGRRDPPPRRAWRGPVDQLGAAAGPQQPPDPEQDADGSAGAALSGRQLRRGRLRAQGRRGRPRAAAAYRHAVPGHRIPHHDSSTPTTT